MASTAAAATGPIPVGVNLASVRVTGGWWLESARRLEDAGAASIWCWDHFVSRGRRSDPVLECWTTLAATAAVTERVRVGSFVTNPLNRHPSVLARTAASLQELSGGRVEVGIGIGGHPREHEALGLGFPDVPERIARLEEAVGVLRALWSGGPLTVEGRYYRLTDAVVAPAEPRPPRVIVGGQTPAGARLAARVGDGWTTNARDLELLLPVFLEALEATGRRRQDVAIVAALGLSREDAEEGRRALRDLPAALQRWREAGADELVLEEVRPEQLDAVMEALASVA